jgi:hypothetical protein
MDARTSHLMSVKFTGAFPPYDLGETPLGRRRLVPITGGTFRGERLSGEVVPFGADWALINRNGVFDADVRALLRTDDGVYISIRYTGKVHSPSGRLGMMLERKGIPPDLYYRMSAQFECATNSAYGWLNNIVTILVGTPVPGGSDYEIFEVL